MMIFLHLFAASHDSFLLTPSLLFVHNLCLPFSAVLVIFLVSSVKSCLLLTSASKIEPMKALDSRFTERSKATPGVTSAISSTAGLAPLDR